MFSAAIVSIQRGQSHSCGENTGRRGNILLRAAEIGTGPWQQWRRWQLPTLAVGLAILLSSSLHADDQTADLVPEDTCILQLTLPEGATVTLDGKDYGAKRQITLDAITPHKVYLRQLVIRYPSGQTSEHKLVLEGGRRVRLARLDPKMQLPEFVAQRVTAACGTPRFQFSRDETKLLLYEGKAALCDVSTGRILRAFGDSGPAHVATCYAPSVVAFLPKGEQLLYGPAIWDMATGKKVYGVQEGARDLRAAAVSPNGRYLLVGVESYGQERDYAALWDIENGQKVRTFELHANPLWSVDSVAFSPDGRQVLVGSSQGTLALWAIASGERIGLFKVDEEPRGVEYNSAPVAFCNNGRQVFVGRRLWDVKSGRKLRDLDGTVFAVSPDGRSVLAGHGGWNPDTKKQDPGSAVLWDVESGRKLQTFTGDLPGVRSLAFSPDGEQVLTGIESGTAILWDVAGGKKLRTFSGTDPLACPDVAFSPSGRYIAAVDLRGATIWNSRSGESVARIPPLAPVYDQLLVGPNGRWIARGKADASGAYGEVSILDVTSAQSVPLPQAAKLLCFSPREQCLVTQSKAAPSMAVVWDVETRRELQTLKGHSKDVLCAAYSKDGQQVLTGSRDGAVILWDAATGQRLKTFEGHKDWVSSVAFSPDGRQVLADGGTTAAWDVGSGNKIPESKTPNMAARHKMVRTYDDDYVVDCKDPDLEGARVKDAVLRLQNGEAGECIHEYRGHPGQILDFQICREANVLIASGFDDLVLYWDIATGASLATVALTPSGMVVSTPEGLFDGSPEAVKNICFRIGGGLNVVPVDRFYKDFYRPGLLAAILRGERPLPEIEIGKQLPPKLRIVSPEPGNVDKRDVTVVVAATDEGGGISDFGIFQNNARLLTDSETTREGETTRRTFHIRLVEGDNELTVRAACKDGSWESEPATVRLRYEKSVPGAELYLVAVGINKYAQETMNLRFARPDAEAMVDLFNKRGESLYGGSKIHAWKLLDAEATAANIEKTLREVAQKAQPQDTLVVTMSGHGTMLGSLYYFLPYEVKGEPGKPVEDAIRADGLPQHQLNDWMSRVPVLKRVLILDTCQSGGAIGLGQTARSPWQFKKAMESMSRAQGSFILGAAAAGEEAQEVADLGHGVLTYTLLAGLGAIEHPVPGVRPIEQPADKKLITVRNWFSFAQDKVPVLTKLFFEKEQFVNFEVSGQDFPILPLERQNDAATEK